MLTAELKEALASSVSQVLEEEAFLFLEPLESASSVETWPREILFAKLKVETEFFGEIGIATSLEVGIKLAEGILGTGSEEGNILESAGDALGEVANVSAGVFLDRVMGANGTWELGLPEVRVTGAEDYLREREGASFVTLFEDEEGNLVELTFFRRED